METNQTLFSKMLRKVKLKVLKGYVGSPPFNQAKMHCHAFFAFIDARRRWEEQQILTPAPAPLAATAPLAVDASAPAPAPAPLAVDAPAPLEKSVRCCATTNAGKRCRTKTIAADGLCTMHRTHGDKKKEAPMSHRRGSRESDDYDAFCRSYYDILRELYNVAGDEMEEEFIRFTTLGRGAYNAFHAKNFPEFRKHIR
jgi:hypothetical protein